MWFWYFSEPLVFLSLISSYLFPLFALILNQRPVQLNPGTLPLNYILSHFCSWTCLAVQVTLQLMCLILGWQTCSSSFQSKCFYFCLFVFYSTEDWLYSPVTCFNLMALVTLHTHKFLFSKLCQTLSHSMAYLLSLRHRLSYNYEHLSWWIDP